MRTPGWPGCRNSAGRQRLTAWHWHDRRVGLAWLWRLLRTTTWWNGASRTARSPPGTSSEDASPGPHRTSSAPHEHRADGLCARLLSQITQRWEAADERPEIPATQAASTMPDSDGSESAVSPVPVLALLSPPPSEHFLPHSRKDRTEFHSAGERLCEAIRGQVDRKGTCSSRVPRFIPESMSNRGHALLDSVNSTLWLLLWPSRR